MAAEARAAAEAEAAAAAAAADARAAAKQERDWKAATALSEEQRRRDAAAAYAAAEKEAHANDMAARALHDASAGGDAGLVRRLLEGGSDPTRTHGAYGVRVAYEVATNGDVRDAFRRYRREHVLAHDWAAARVPSTLSEAEEAVAQEAAKQAAKERKRAHERARKERRRTDAEARDAILESLRTAAAAEEQQDLEAALREAEEAGLSAEELAPHAAVLGALRDPANRQRREREQRTEAARQRLGHLTVAQTRLVRGEASREGDASGGADAEEADCPDCDEQKEEEGGNVSTPNAADAEVPLLRVSLSYKGRVESASVRGTDEVRLLFEEASRLFDLPPETHTLKIILKGKALQPTAHAAEVLGANGAKLMVMASAREALAAVQKTASDPTVASFAAEHGSRKAGIPVVRGRAARR